jgi:steroid 5-alpha reductase family enzyme
MVLLLALFFLSLLMAFAWLLQRRWDNAGAVDICWAMGLGFVALLIGSTGSGNEWLRLLIALMGGIWGFRLAIFLLARALREPEDGRYRKLREHWGSRQQLRLFWLFQAEAWIAIVLAVPLYVVANNPVMPSISMISLAVAIWAVAVVGETVADFQLTRFRTRMCNRQKTCREGLWRYSRHPNYFFEWLHWFAYIPLAIGSPIWWLSLIGPLFMFVLLYRVTGIPFSEQQALRTRGDDYRNYQACTSPLIPWLPRYPKE